MKAVFALCLLLAPFGGVGPVSFGWQPAHSYVYAVSGTQPNQYSENLQTAQVADSATGTAGIWYTFLTNGRDTAQTWQCAFNPQAASVLGYGAGIVDTEWQAVGQFGDTLHIPLSLSFGDEFWFQTHPIRPGNGYRGKVTGIHLTHTLGLPDTLLMIELQYHSTGLPAANVLNGSTFQTSSRFGLRSLPHLAIPQIFPLVELVGENSQQLGVTDFGFYEVYNFQVGDVFHYEGWSFGDTWYQCDTINSVVYDSIAGCISYQAKRWRYTATLVPIFDPQNPTGQPIGWDTTYSTTYGDVSFGIGNDGTLDFLFGQFNEDLPGSGIKISGFMYLQNDQLTAYKSIVPYYSQIFLPNTDTCWQQVIDSGPTTWGVRKGKVGLEYFGGYEYQVFYHHSNGDSGGTAINPSDFTVSQPETAQALPLTVFPNPAREHLTVRLPFDSQYATFTLRDTEARIVRELVTQPGDTRLVLNGLPTGLYIWQAVGADGRTATGRIVVQ